MIAINIDFLTKNKLLIAKNYKNTPIFNFIRGEFAS